MLWDKKKIIDQNFAIILAIRNILNIDNIQHTRCEGMWLYCGVIEEPVSTPGSGELLVNETAEGRADHAVVRWSLCHTTHDKIDVVGMGINCTQFSHHLVTE